MREQLLVHPEQIVDPRQRRRSVVAGLGECQEGDRPDDDRSGFDAECLCFRDLAENLVGVQPERGVAADLGDQIVVVGVEPLGHLQRSDVRGATCRGEVSVEWICDAVEPLGECTEKDRGVEYLVVVGEGVDRNRVETGCGQLFDGVASQSGCDLVELGSADAARPVAFDRPLEFAARADPRRAVHGGGERPANRIRRRLGDGGVC